MTDRMKEFPVTQLVYDAICSLEVLSEKTGELEADLMAARAVIVAFQKDRIALNKKIQQAKEKIEHDYHLADDPAHTESLMEIEVILND